MPNISGTVYKTGSDERVKYAVVKAYSKGKAPIIATTDDDGDFDFKNLEAGKWSLLVLDESSLPEKVPEFQLTKDRSNLKIELQRIADTKDLKVGTKLFYSMLIALGILVVLYILLHIFIHPKDISSPNSFIWSTGKFQYFELLLWSMAGILVNKIIICGWYIRSNRFYREGLFMHIAHLVTTPLLVLVTVIILSLASISIKLANSNEFVLNLSEPNVMIAAAFILGTNPWPLWGFVEGTAKKITGSI